MDWASYSRTMTTTEARMEARHQDLYKIQNSAAAPLAANEPEGPRGLRVPVHRVATPLGGPAY